MATSLGSAGSEGVSPLLFCRDQERMLEVQCRQLIAVASFPAPGVDVCVWHSMYMYAHAFMKAWHRNAQPAVTAPGRGALQGRRQACKVGCTVHVPAYHGITRQAKHTHEGHTSTQHTSTRFSFAQYVQGSGLGTWLRVRGNTKVLNKKREWSKVSFQHRYGVFSYTKKSGRLQTPRFISNG